MNRYFAVVLSILTLTCGALAEPVAPLSLNEGGSILDA
jgi:hypothetical protein